MQFDRVAPKIAWIGFFVSLLMHLMSYLSIASQVYQQYFVVIWLVMVGLAIGIYSAGSVVKRESVRQNKSLFAPLSVFVFYSLPHWTRLVLFILFVYAFWSTVNAIVSLETEMIAIRGFSAMSMVAYSGFVAYYHYNAEGEAGLE